MWECVVKAYVLSQHLQSLCIIMLVLVSFATFLTTALAVTDFMVCKLSPTWKCTSAVICFGRVPHHLYGPERSETVHFRDLLEHHSIILFFLFNISQLT